ncbi:hypothetical protein FB451DRAFT_1153805, partial [Mycena latifolia]
MPLINNSTGIQIHGGIFYEVAGDVNLETHQHLVIQDDKLHDIALRPRMGSTVGLEDDWTGISNHELSGVMKNPRHAIHAMQSPCNTLFHPQLSARSYAEIEEHIELPSSRSESPFVAAARHGPQSNHSEISPSISLSPIGPYLTFPGTYAMGSASPANVPPGPQENHCTSWPQPDSRIFNDSASDYPPAPYNLSGLHVHPEDVSDPFVAEPPQSNHGGTFITARNVHHNHSHAEAGVHILHRAVALEALHDSAESFPQPRCHPETRTAMLDALYHWAVDDACSIRWLHGPAGAGKSAIMQTLSRRLQENGRLGGSFFFKRDHPIRGNAKVLF